MDAELCRQNLFDDVYQSIKHFWFWRASFCITTGQEEDWLPLKTHEIMCILQIFSSPDQNLQPYFICEFIVFYYKSWLLKMSSSQVSFCFMYCSGGRTLSVNQSHSSKRNILDLPLQLLLSTYRLLGGQEWGAYLLSKCQRINIENKFSNKESFEEIQFRYSKGIKDAIKPRFWELISKVGFSPMGGVNLEIGMIKEIVAKALDGQRYPCPA